jgi:hypothetical protein
MSARDPFRAAAGAYLVYGVVYWIGGAYLALHGVGVRGSAATAGRSWIVLGAVFVFLVPYLLGRRRAWFERWILSRRDFARILVVLMAFRAWKVGHVALRPETATVAAPWGGVITFRLGAIVFFLVTVAALAMIARAAWRSEPPIDSTHPQPDPAWDGRTRAPAVSAHPRSNPSSEGRSQAPAVSAHPRSNPSSPPPLQ